MDNESWLTYQEALEMGFATSVGKDDESENPSQSVKCKLINLIKQSQQAEDDEEEIDEADVDDEETTEEDSETSLDDEDDTEETEDDEEEHKATEKVVAFFNAMIGGM